ncbi:TPA: phage minor tail protein L, partial [Salmonella enterica subsp. diarizonae serovar 60-67:z35:-]
MQDIPQDTLNETTKPEQSAKVDLWEFDLTAIGGERYFFCKEPNEKGEPLTWQGRQYQPYPIKAQDFEMSGKGPSPRVGGRITDLDIATRTLTLDREITLPESGTAMLNIVGPDGEPFSTEIQSQPAPDRVVLKVLPDNMQPYSVWGLKLPSLKRRLFRCVAIREGENNTYAITAVQHVPEKESIVDNGAHFDPLPGTTNSIIPPAVQHLVVDTDTDNSLYQAKAKWDTPRVVKGVRFILRLTTGSGKDDDPVRLVTTVTISEMQ